jgi:hypothetical protein
VNKLPEYAVILSHSVLAFDAPSAAGKANAKKTSKANREQIKEAAFYWLEPKQLDDDYHLGSKSLTIESYEILKILNNLESDRLQINTHNFIDTIESMKAFFHHPIDAVHAFYTMVAYWDITSTVAERLGGSIQMVGFKGHHLSDEILVPAQQLKDFKRFIETHYVFTNEGSGLTVDYYFSRFDEVMARLDPEYIKQHGIFFTDSNLSKFALWFAKYHFPGDIDENYIVFDPAGGSGNLISSWRGKLKHKIISELQPDLLRTIERRMKVDPWHVEDGFRFTIIPKTSENKGLNFLDKTAAEYLSELQKELQLKNVQLDKPLAFLLNPPYKNTDENKTIREDKEANYVVDESILQLTGDDAGKERYLAFLGQILNICEEQVKLYPQVQPVVMIFTPTSWLIPRPTYKSFREEWDKHFSFSNGFIITSNEFFSLKGTWPLAFTMWTYSYNEDNKNAVQLFDLTVLKKHQLNNVNWNLDDTELNFQLNDLLSDVKIVKLDNSRGDIRNTLPLIERKDELIKQTRYDYSTAKRPNEYGKIVSGFPEKDFNNHFELNRKCGDAMGEFIGFMDDITPVRIKQDTLQRMSIKPDRIWFRLDLDFKGVNKTKCFNGAADNRSYCAYDLASAKATCSWFAITKALNSRYPLWANQYDIWQPNIKPEQQDYWFALCFAFVLAENRCVVTKFEKDNPVVGAPEVYVDNPLCPTNKESFWSTTLEPSLRAQQSNLNSGTAESDISASLINVITELYKYWNTNYCKGEILENVGLHNEPYFKYFSYPDFLTPHSGLIQIKKYAESEGLHDLISRFDEVSALTKKVREELWRLLVVEFKYFE